MFSLYNSLLHLMLKLKVLLFIFCGHQVRFIPNRRRLFPICPRAPLYAACLQGFTLLFSKTVHVTMLGQTGICLAQHPVWHWRLQSHKNPQIYIYRLPALLFPRPSDGYVFGGCVPLDGYFCSAAHTETSSIFTSYPWILRMQ